MKNKAAEAYIADENNYSHSRTETFKAGAQWQKEKDSQLPKIWERDTIDEYAYQVAYDLSNDWAKEVPNWHDVETACKLGAEWKEVQMMKYAVDGVCSLEFEDGTGAVRTASDTNFKLNGLHCGDKVKLIVIKQD